MKEAQEESAPVRARKEDEGVRRKKTGHGRDTQVEGRENMGR